MKSHQPSVSIITPVYNGSKYLEELIKSVLEQDYPRIEHIIIDDGSNDDGATVQILKRYPHLRWWSRPNKGQIATQNEGLSASTGEIVTVICADDKYASSTAISAAVELLLSNGSYDAVYGETIIIDENGREHDRQPPGSGPLWLFRYHSVVLHCSLLLKRSVVVDAGFLFDERFPYLSDYDWINRLIRGGCRFRRLRKPIARYREHSMQRTHDVSAARIEERRTVIELHGKPNPMLAFFVNKWWRSVKFMNLFRRRGLLACCQAIRAHFNHEKLEP